MQGEISYAEVLAYRVPETRQHVRSRDAAFYALSVGLGQDPLDTRQLRFVDPDRADGKGEGLTMVPSMALILGYPGFWMADNRIGIDATQVVHIEQSLTWRKHVCAPVTVIGKTTVEGLYNRPTAKGLVMNSRREVFDADTGDLLVTLSQRHLLRGNVCREAPILPAGDNEQTGPSQNVERTTLRTRPEQALYYRLNGDLNPLHSDPDLARAAGFPLPILHGMCTFGVLTHGLLATACDYLPTRVESISMRFVAPVYPGESLELAVAADGSFEATSVERGLKVVDNGALALFPAEATTAEARSAARLVGAKEVAR